MILKVFLAVTAEAKTVVHVVLEEVERGVYQVSLPISSRVGLSVHGSDLAIFTSNPLWSKLCFCDLDNFRVFLDFFSL